jgi:prostatic aicd phosphatase
VPLSEFISYLSVSYVPLPWMAADDPNNSIKPVTVNTTSDWCTVCHNTQDRGCNQITSAVSQGHAQALFQQSVNPLGAGFLGAGLALVVAATLLAVFYFCGLVRFGKSKRVNLEGTSEKSSG